MRVLARQSCLVASILVAACDNSAIDSRRSLVGAKKLPSREVLSGETIQISHVFSGPGAQRLTFELRPNESLTVTLAATDGKIQGAKQTFQLSSTIAAQARWKLWRIRPEREGVGWTAPSDCPAQAANARPDLTVVFLTERPGELTGIVPRATFGLPPKSICNTKAAEEARNLVRSVVQSFPPSKLPAEFSERKWRSEALLRRSQSN